MGMRTAVQAKALMMVRSGLPTSTGEVPAIFAFGVVWMRTQLRGYRLTDWRSRGDVN